METVGSNLLGILCGGFGIFVFFVIGIVIIILSIRARKKAEASQSWPAVPGQIISAEIKKDISEDADGYTTTMYKPIVTYSYNVMGQAYQSSKMAFGMTTSYGRTAKAQEVLDQYPLNSTVNVYYDPENPAEAVLERKAGGKVLGLVIGILFLFLSLCVGLPLLIYFGLIQNL